MSCSRATLARRRLWDGKPQRLQDVSKPYALPDIFLRASRLASRDAPHACPSCGVYLVGRKKQDKAERTGVPTPREARMSDKSTMLRETVEAFADLRTMLDGLTEEQASRIQLGVLGVRDLMIHWPGMLREGDGQTPHALESMRKARLAWA